MTYKNENAMVEQKNFTLPVMVEAGDFSSEDLAEDYDGLQLSFQRIKIPAGGALQFELPGDNPEDPDYAKTLEGVIIYNHQACAYWPEGSEFDDDAIPLCSSVDGKTGFGEPGGACSVCQMNQYGTATDKNGNTTKGKACKNMRHLYLLRDGEYMPILLALPPTSLRPFSDFMNASFVSRRRPVWSSVVQIGLKRVENGANTYSVATFRKLYDFSGEQLQQIKQYAEGFREQIRTMLHQRAINTETRTESDIMYEAVPDYSAEQNGEHFTVTAAHTIDGDREGLPL